MHWDKLASAREELHDAFNALYDSLEPYQLDAATELGRAIDLYEAVVMDDE